MNAYKQGYLAGYHFGDIAPDPTYRGDELRQYWRGFEQGEIDRAMGVFNEGERNEGQHRAASGPTTDGQ